MSTEQDHKRHAFLMEHGLGNFYKLAPDHVGYITGATMEKLVDLALATLTDEQIDALIREHLGGMRDGGMALYRNLIRAALAAASAPAQHAAPVPEQNYAECWVCGRPMDGKSEDDCHCFHRKELSPLPPAALAAARAFGAGLDADSLEQPSEVV